LPELQAVIHRIQSERIDESERIITDIRIEIQPTVEANRILADETLENRTVISSAVGNETGPSFYFPVNENCCSGLRAV
jgi:hypothetical protein